MYTWAEVTYGLVPGVVQQNANTKSSTFLIKHHNLGQIVEHNPLTF